MHRETSLQDFNKLLRQFKQMLKIRSNQTGQLHKLVLQNFSTFHLAQRTVQSVSNTLTKVDFYNKNILELHETINSIITNSNMSIVELKRIHSQLRS
jgi:hypothetical protein